MTDVGALEIVAIGKGHRREAFDCGEAALNDYLRRYARQNHERNLARSFVAVDAGKRVLGYHSLASAAVEFESLPPDYAKRLPRYPVPAVRIARLAVDRAMQGKGLGERLLADALKRISRRPAPSASRSYWWMPRARAHVPFTGVTAFWNWRTTP